MTEFGFISQMEPRNSESIQATRIPPKAPLDELKANLLKRLGAIFFKKRGIMISILIFQMQKIEQLSSILSHGKTFAILIKPSNIPIQHIPGLGFSWKVGSSMTK